MNSFVRDWREMSWLMLIAVFASVSAEARV